MTEVTAQFQELYSADEPSASQVGFFFNKTVAVFFVQVHLLPYPIIVGEDGSVSVMEGWECFPDTEAKVFGEKSGTLPGKLTT